MSVLVGGRCAKGFQTTIVHANVGYMRKKPEHLPPRTRHPQTECVVKGGHLSSMTETANACVLTGHGYSGRLTFNAERLQLDNCYITCRSTMNKVYRHEESPRPVT